MASIGVAAVLAMIPISASADKFPVCPPGVTDPTYCAKVTKCVVPNVVGKRLKKAKQLFRKHDCAVGKVSEASDNGDPKDVDPPGKNDEGVRVVVKQKRRPGKILKK